MKTIRTDWAAINGLGVCLYTFSDFEIGREWVRRNAAIHVGLELHEIAVVARRVYRPRGVRVVRSDPFEIPAVAA